MKNALIVTLFTTVAASNAPHGSVVMIDHARHFVMLDQPAAFDRALFAAIEESAP